MRPRVIATAALGMAFAMAALLFACNGKKILGGQVSGQINAAFTIDRIEPPMGASGTLVTIFGNGLRTDAVAITLDGQTVTDLEQKEGGVALVIPSGSPGLVLISITANGETRSTTFYRTDGVSSVGGAGDPTDPSWKFGLIVSGKGSGDEGGALEFIWERSYMATHYQLLLAKNKDCTEPGYDSGLITERQHVVDKVADGTWYLCLFATNETGAKHPADNHGMKIVVDTTPPTATIASVSPVTNGSSFDVKVSGKDVVQYRYKFGTSTDTDCANEDGYHSERQVNAKLNVMTQFMAGEYRLCVLGADAARNWQSADKATFVTWEVDNTGPSGVSLGTSVGTRYGQIVYDVSVAAATDATKMKLVGQSGSTPPGDCNHGTEHLNTTTMNSVKVTVNGTSGQMYSVRLCAFDALGNETSVMAMGSATFSNNVSAFVTSELFDGNLSADYNRVAFSSAFDGADYRCQHLANEAQLGGVWRAMLTHKGQRNLYDWTAVPGDVYDLAPTPNKLTAFSGKFGLFNSDLMTSLARDELGNVVGGNAWTGSAGSPTSSYIGDSNDHCEGWTSNSDGDTGRIGVSTETDNDRFSNADRSCDQSARLYCIEQPKDVRLVGFSGMMSTTTTASITVAFKSGVVYPPMSLIRYDDDGDGNYRCNRSGGTVVKTFDGTAANPFADQTVNDSGLSPGAYLYSLCYLDSGAVLDARSVALQVGRIHRLFVTSTQTNGNFGGTTGADAICAARASAASLTGSWKALVSTDTADALTHLALTGSVWNMKNQILAANPTDFWDGMLAAPAYYDEFGAPSGSEVWTGSTTAGETAAENCSNFSSIIGTGIHGKSANYDGSWVAHTQADCSESRSLYCVDAPDL